MNKIQAYKIIKKSPKQVFSTGDLKKLFDVKSPNTLNKQIQGLVREQVLTRATKGFYYLTEDEPLSFSLANVFYRPSYISLESALNYYGILIQSPRQVTSVTPKLTKTISNHDRTYSYAHLDPKYYDSYQTIDGFLIATPEKALVDMMYFTSLNHASFSIEELNLSAINHTRLNHLALRIKHPAFKKFFNTIAL
jgi:predicted transcriptional regulator of viral defense system